MPRIHLLWPTLLWSGLASTTAVAQTCDAALTVNSVNPAGYQPRGDRCEGQYAQPVSATALRLWGASYDDIATGTIQLGFSWIPAGTAVRLRVRSRRPNRFYQMDATLPRGRASFSWPRDVLTRLGISPSELVPLVTTTIAVGTSQKELILPAYRPGSKREQVSVYVVPGIRFARVQYAISRFHSDKPSLVPVAGQTDAPGGTSAVSSPLRILLPRLDAGIYYLALTGTLANKSTVSRGLWFRAGP
jgi:hypothetical protein